MVGREAVTTKRCARHTVGVSKVPLLWYHKKDEKVPEDQGERAALAASRMKEERVPAGRRRGEWDNCYFPTCAEMSSLFMFVQKKTRNQSGGSQARAKCVAGNYLVR